MTEQTCPPLGTGSVELNVLHNAARQGHDLDKALKQATTLPSDKDAVPDETAPAPVDAAEATVPAGGEPEADEDDTTRAKRAR